MSRLPLPKTSLWKASWKDVKLLHRDSNQGSSAHGRCANRYAKARHVVLKPFKNYSCRAFAKRVCGQPGKDFFCAVNTVASAECTQAF